MKRFSALVALVMVGVLAGCEPKDTGGGGGVAGNGHLAFIQENVLVSEAEDNTEKIAHTTTGTVSADPQLSPNGATIVFTYSPSGNAAAASIYVVPTASASNAGLQALVDPSGNETLSSPIWDVAGSNIYYLSTSGGTTQLKRVASAGVNQPEAVGNVAGIQRIAAVDADTLLLSVAPNGDLETFGIATGATTPTGITGVNRFAVSHDGKSVAYTDNTGNIVVQALGTGSFPKKIAVMGVGKDAGITFSPDNTSLAFELSGNISQIKVDGTGFAQTLFSGASEPSWSL